MRSKRVVCGVHGTAGTQDHDELCLEAVDLMLKILGAEAGHMGIRLLASGGVFLTGLITACYNEHKSA